MNYKITAVQESPRSWSSKYGKDMLSYKVLLEGETGEHELTQLATSPAPVVGQMLEDYAIEIDPKWGKKVRRVKTGQSFGGGGKSPADKEAIDRAVAFKGAVELLAAEIKGGDVNPSVYPQSVKSLTEALLPIVKGTPQPAPPAPSEPMPVPDVEPGHIHPDVLKKAYNEFIEREGEAGKKQVDLMLTAMGVKSSAEMNADQAKQAMELFSDE